MFTNKLIFNVTFNISELCKPSFTLDYVQKPLLLWLFSANVNKFIIFNLKFFTILNCFEENAALSGIEY